MYKSSKQVEGFADDRDAKEYKSSAEFWIGVPVRHHLHWACTNLQRTAMAGPVMFSEIVDGLCGKSPCITLLAVHPLAETGSHTSPKHWKTACAVAWRCFTKVNLN